MTMTADMNLVEMVKKECAEKDGRLIFSCAQAFKLADKHGMKLVDIAQVCDDNKIKLVKCQLGCF